MIPWEKLDEDKAPDGKPLVLRRRGDEFLITADGYDLMSSEDEGSSRALATLGCAHLPARRPGRVLVGGLGMGYTLRAALDATGPRVQVEVAELVPAVVRWNEGPLAALAGAPLKDPRSELILGDVRKRIRAAGETGATRYDAILLDVDNGPESLAHRQNNALYGDTGVSEAWAALSPGGIFGVWSFGDDRRFTTRLQKQGFQVDVQRVDGSRRGRGRFHWIWIAQRPAQTNKRPHKERPHGRRDRKKIPRSR